MADTAGLLKTRGEWTDAVAAGETTLPHKDWYEQKYGAKKAEEEAKAIEAGYKKADLARKTGRSVA